MNKQFLENMLETCSVSGHEEELQRKVIDYMKADFDILSDATGNVISVLNKESDIKVLLCGHIDEIGFLVKSIDSNADFILFLLLIFDVSFINSFSGLDFDQAVSRCLFYIYNSLFCHFKKRHKCNDNIIFILFVRD